MLYLKCTAEIQKVLKLSKASLVEAEPNWRMVALQFFPVLKKSCTALRRTSCEYMDYLLK